jgi:hypothetical protein
MTDFSWEELRSRVFVRDKGACRVCGEILTFKKYGNRSPPSAGGDKSDVLWTKIVVIVQAHMRGACHGIPHEV